MKNEAARKILEGEQDQTGKIQALNGVFPNDRPAMFKDVFEYLKENGSDTNKFMSAFGILRELDQGLPAREKTDIQNEIGQDLATLTIPGGVDEANRTNIENFQNGYGESALSSVERAAGSAANHLRGRLERNEKSDADLKRELQGLNSYLDGEFNKNPSVQSKEAQAISAEEDLDLASSPVNIRPQMQMPTQGQMPQPQPVPKPEEMQEQKPDQPEVKKEQAAEPKKNQTPEKNKPAAETGDDEKKKKKKSKTRMFLEDIASVFTPSLKTAMSLWAIAFVAALVFFPPAALPVLLVGVGGATGAALTGAAKALNTPVGEALGKTLLTPMTLSADIINGVGKGMAAAVGAAMTPFNGKTLAENVKSATSDFPKIGEFTRSVYQNGKSQNQQKTPPAPAATIPIAKSEAQAKKEKGKGKEQSQEKSNEQKETHTQGERRFPKPDKPLPQPPNKVEQGRGDEQQKNTTSNKPLPPTPDEMRQEQGSNQQKHTPPDKPLPPTPDEVRQGQEVTKYKDPFPPHLRQQIDGIAEKMRAKNERKRSDTGKNMENSEEQGKGNFQHKLNNSVPSKQQHGIG